VRELCTASGVAQSRGRRGPWCRPAASGKSSATNAASSTNAPPGCGTQPLQINLGAFGQVLVEGDGVDGPDPSIEVSHELAEVDCARPGKGRGDHHHRALRQMPVALCFQLCSVALSAAHLPQPAAVFAAPQNAAALPPPMETKVHSVVVSPPLHGKEPMTVLGGSLDWCYRWP